MAFAQYLPSDRFQKGSWVQILSNQVLDPQQRASQVKKLQGMLFFGRNLLPSSPLLCTATLKLSHNLLKGALSQALSPLDESEYQQALDVDFYDQVLGMFQLNNPRIEITSPLYGYCSMVAAAPGGPALVASNATLRNLMAKLGQKVRSGVI